MSLDKLIKKCKSQDINAQEQLYQLYAKKLFAVSLKYSRNYTEAEDNLQDAFITIFEKIAQYGGAGSFEGWLKRITINTALQKYRKEQLFEIIDQAALKAPDVEVDEESFSLEYLLKCIQELPNRYRLVFNLYVLDGYSHKEIAEALNISVGTSKSNLARARMVLKQRIEEEQPNGLKSI